MIQRLEDRMNRSRLALDWLDHNQFIDHSCLLQNKPLQFSYGLCDFSLFTSNIETHQFDEARWQVPAVTHSRSRSNIYIDLEYNLKGEHRRQHQYICSGCLLPSHLVISVSQTENDNFFLMSFLRYKSNILKINR